MTIAMAAAAYFAIVFSIGFALGVVRTLWLVPLLGERVAELVEMPLMVLASFVAARLIVTRGGESLHGGAAALVGVVAFGLLLCAELGVVVVVRGQSIADYVASRDPVSGSAYVIALLSFAALPYAVVRSRSNRARAR